jgi:hypothetical protein
MIAHLPWWEKFHKKPLKSSAHHQRRRRSDQHNISMKNATPVII